MPSRLFRPVRALRVLLACVVLWFGSSASAPRELWNDTAVVIVADGVGARAGESRKAGLETDETEARSGAPARRERARGASAAPREAGARRPTRDLYLRNCVLLC